MSRDAPYTASGPSNVISFGPLREQIGRLFDELANASPRHHLGEGSFQFSPPNEVLETHHELWMNIELPGVLLEDVSITSTPHTIVVSGEKRSDLSREGDERFFSTREFGAFYQSFSLPMPIDPDKITAELANGVLSIRVPTSTEVMPTRSVPITSRPI